MKTFTKKLRLLSTALGLLTALMIFMVGCAGSSTPEMYTVTFETGNGTKISAATVQSGTLLKDVPGFTATLESTEATFKGWQVNDTLVNPNTYSIDKDVTVTAKWIISVTVDPNGGKFADNSTDSKVFECETGTKLSEISDFPANASKSNVNFKSWSVSGTDISSTYVVKANCTIQAHWVAEVTFEANGGKFTDETTTKTVEVEIGSKVTAPKITRESVGKSGYVCKNWSSTQYSVDYENPVLFDWNTEISQNITLYAYYTSIPKTDYLILMYMDGDNNLNDAIWIDINEAEYGLSLIRNSADVFDAKTGYSTVNVVVLWDGWSVREPDPEDTEAPYAQLGKSGTFIYQLGIDEGCNLTYTNSSGAVLSSTTKDLSATASWLTNEVDMSNKETVKKFLEWSQENFTADHIILQFSNHGGGPRSRESSRTVLPNGLEFYNPDPNLRRAMCWDETSGGKTFLTTKDIPWAISESGLGKVDMIIEDVCLGGSVEEAYELRNSAKYILASPNNVPGRGYDYIELMKHFTTGNLAKEDGGMREIGTEAIKDYRNFYKKADDYWTTYKSDVEEQFGRTLTNEQISLLYTSRATLSLIDLSKMEAVKNAFSDLYISINDVRTYSISGITYDSSNKYLKQGSEDTSVYFPQFMKYIYNVGMYDDELSIIHISYQGTYAWLHDSANLSVNTKALISSLSNSSSYSKVTSKCNALQTALGNAVVSAWADGYNPSVGTDNSSGALYEIYNGTPSNSSIYNSKGYGLTVCGESVAGYLYEGKTVYTHASKPSFYDSALSFSTDSNWDKALTLIFGN